MHIFEEVKDNIEPHHPEFSHMATLKCKGGWEISSSWVLRKRSRWWIFMIT